MTQTFLSELAIVGPLKPTRGQGPVTDPLIESLMVAHGWTMLRARREQLGYSRSAMALCLGLAAPTYALLEEGAVALCRWTGPGLEMALLAAPQQSCRFDRCSGINAPLERHYVADCSGLDGYPL